MAEQATKVVTGKVRFSYANVFVPRKIDENSEPKYSVTLLIPKTDKATVAKINAAIEAAKAAYKDKHGALPAKYKNPFKDGDVDYPDDPNYAGHYYVAANAKNKPRVVDRYVKDIENTTEFYSGCYGKASINFYPYNVGVNKGIGCGLNNLQKLEDGEPLGGVSRPEDDFEAAEADDIL